MKTTKPKMNIRLLRRIQKQIAKEPKQFGMSYWFAFREGVPNCGTTACLAGWALSLAAKKNPLNTAKGIRKSFGGNLLELVGEHTRSIQPKARKLLGITKIQGDRLFFTFCWPDEFWHLYHDAKSNQRKAKAAIARIDHFIKTGL